MSCTKYMLEIMIENKRNITACIHGKAVDRRCSSCNYFTAMGVVRLRRRNRLHLTQSAADTQHDSWKHAPHLPHLTIRFCQGKIISLRSQFSQKKPCAMQSWNWFWRAKKQVELRHLDKIEIFVTSHSKMCFSHCFMNSVFSFWNDPLRTAIKSTMDQLSRSFVRWSGMLRNCCFTLK